MITVGFFLQNRKIENVDLSTPEMGNPGCGGREFVNVSIAYYVSRQAPSAIRPVVYSQKAARLPATLENVPCGDVGTAIQRAGEAGADLFVADASLSEQRMRDLVGAAETAGVPLVVILHLVPGAASLAVLAASPGVRAVVCVERETLEMLWDHPVREKALVIPNGVPMAAFEEAESIEQDPRMVVYLGSLTPQKGFGLLAQAWPSIVARVPDARLAVIGSGRVYDHQCVLGDWGVAEERFEAKQIRPFLSGDDGQPMPSIDFLGALGEEKVPLLARACVGVANPRGYTETFCISAVEIQACGTPVVAGARGGLFDTVRHGNTGYLVRNRRQLSDRIVDLLEDPGRAAAMGQSAREFVAGRYDFEVIGRQWVDTLCRLSRGEMPEQPSPKPTCTTLEARLVRINACIRRLPVAKRWWPSVVDVRGGMLGRVWRGVRRVLRGGRVLRRSG